MANKIYWCGEIPADVKWLTFADQTKENKGYKYNNDFTQISAFTDDNNSLPYDDIKFVVDYNSNVNSRYCKVKFTQKGDKGDKIGYCYISQNGTDFEQLWKHVSKKSDAVIAQSHNETMNPYEVAVGNFNRTRGNLLFSVGNGKDENHRGNSFEVDDEKISADKAYITDLTADTFNATTLNAANIVNGSGADFVSYSSATKNTDTGLYPIGILTINTKKNVIYGKRDKDIEYEVRNLSANTLTKEEFKHYCDSSASGLTDEFSAFTTKFDTLSGTVKEEIKNINLLARTATSNTLSLSETVTDYYDKLTGKVSGVSKSYNELSQTLTGLTDRIGHVETKYDDVSGQIQSVSSITDDFKVSLSGLSNDVSANTRQYNTLNGTVSGLTDSYSKLEQNLSGLTESVGRVETKYDGLSGKIQSVSSVTDDFKVSLSGLSNDVSAITKQYNTLNGQVSGVSKSYNELSQNLSGLTESVGRVETKYDGLSGKIQSVSSVTDNFKVSYSGLSNQVSAITTQYDTLNDQVVSNTQNIGTLSATSETFLSKLDSISVGGVNLLYDTNFDTFNKSDSKWSTWGSPSTLTMAKESDGWNWISIKSTDKFQGINQNQNSRRGAGYKEFKPNTYYTFSVYAYGNSTHMDLGVHFVNETGPDIIGQVWCSNDNNYSKSWGKGVIPLTSTKTRYWFTFKTPDDSTINYFNAMIGFGSLSTNPSSDEVINIAKPQLEEGTIPTDWKESTDDYKKEMSSKIEQTVSSITLSVQEESKNKLLKTGIDIENGKITLNADNTTVKGDFKVSAVNKADGITLINEKGETAIMLKNQPIDKTISNVQNGKFGGTAPIQLSWGTVVLKPYYNETINTQVCYIEAGKQYKIENMNMSIDLDNAGSLNLIKIQLSEGGTVLKTISDAQFNTQSHGLSSLNGTYTATHTGSVVLSMTFTTNFTTNGSHPFINITGTITRDSSSIIAFGEGGFAMGLDTNKYMSFDKINGLTVVNNKDGIRLNEYGLTRFRQSDKGYITYVGEAHNIYHFEGTNGWIDWESVRARAYDTILCTGSKDCNIRLGYSDAYPLVDGMAINIIDKCKANCEIDFAGKPLYKANDTDPTTFGAHNYYELDGHRTWKFIYSAAVDAWIEIATNK